MLRFGLDSLFDSYQLSWFYNSKPILVEEKLLTLRGIHTQWYRYESEGNIETRGRTCLLRRCNLAFYPVRFVDSHCKLEKKKYDFVITLNEAFLRKTNYEMTLFCLKKSPVFVFIVIQNFVQFYTWVVWYLFLILFTFLALLNVYLFVCLFFGFLFIDFFPFIIFFLLFYFH